MSLIPTEQEWKQVYEIHGDYVAGAIGDEDCYVVFNKLSKTYVESKPGHTWWTLNESVAIRKASNLFKKNEASFEKIILDHK